MNRKICVLLIFISMQVFYCTDNISHSYASTGDNNYLRIFTPYHSVKNVFAYVDYVEEKSQGAAKFVSAEQEYEGLKRQFSEDEINLIAGIVHAESKGEPFEGKVGVASVILNRLYHPLFPKSVKEVIYQKNAFSCMIDSSINSEPDKEAYKAVFEALNGKDPTNNAVFFYNPRTASSEWMKSAPKEGAVSIGSHVFFR